MPVPRVRQWLPARAEPWPGDHAPPLDVWWDLIDIWLRLQDLGCLQVLPPGEVRVLGFAKGGVPIDLGQAVADIHRYRWNKDARSGVFLQTLEVEAGDLVCSLAEAEVMWRWPDGPTLVGLRRAFLRRHGGCP